MANEIRPKKFVGLHAHSGASVGDGLGPAKKHIDFVIKNGMDAFALTEHGHMNSFAPAWKHYESKKKAGINFKYIQGVEAYFHPDLAEWAALKKKTKEENEAKKKLKKQGKIVDIEDENESTATIEDENASKRINKDPLKRRHHLVLLPKNSQGLEDLFSLVSFGYTEGQYYFPRIDLKRLKEKKGNIIGTTACLAGLPTWLILQEFKELDWEDVTPEIALTKKDIIIPKLRNMVDQYVDVFGEENFFLELQFNKLVPQHTTNMFLMELSKDTGIPLIATADSHYYDRDKWKARELYKRIAWLSKSKDIEQLPESVEDLKCELFPKNADDMWEEYGKHKDKYSFYDDQVVCDAIERTHDIAHELIDEISPDKKVKLPSFCVPEGQKPFQALVELAKDGLVNRGLDQKQEYIDRLKEELVVIKNKKFSKYFLTMKAIIDVAKKNMLVGFGRGSAAGSLLCYCLGITGIDPIKYNLLFSRFLSPSRADYPDVDSDVSDKDRLFKLIAKEFGNENTISISNINKMQLKSLVKDISKFYGIEFQEVNAACKFVDRDIMQAAKAQGMAKTDLEINFVNAMKYSSAFAEFIELNPIVEEHIHDLAGEQRSLGRHAGGLILSENILGRMPVIVSKKSWQTPWDKKYLEDFGWIKYDMLGLETLAIIESCITLILQRDFGIANPTFKHIKKWYDENLDPDKIDLDDQKVYEHVFHNANYAGTFQCTQKGTQKFFTSAEPRSIVDIAALTSIYRPGPLAADVDQLYVESKNDPDSIEYPHPLVKEVLEETYGHLVFQEQAMALGNVVAGMPLDECDILRKVVSKKPMIGTPDYEPMMQKIEEMGEKFNVGSSKNGVSEEISEDLYQKISEFAKYSFNKSHAVSYAINSFLCAYLLTYHEAEWLCAYVESCILKKDKKAKAISEVKSFGYEMAQLDINSATGRWTILDGKKMMPSFTSCKGVGDKAVEEILDRRPYRDIYDLLYYKDGSFKHSKFNKKGMDVLIRVGALESLDCVGPDKLFKNYAHMHASLIENWDLVKKCLKKETLETQIEKIEKLAEENENVLDWTLDEKLDMCKSLTGEINMNLIISPKKQKQLAKKGYEPIDVLASEEEEELTAFVWFIVESITKLKTKTGKHYLSMKVSGISGHQEQLKVWNWTPDYVVEKNRAYLGILKKDKWGFSTKLNDMLVLPRD